MSRGRRSVWGRGTRFLVPHQQGATLSDLDVKGRHWQMQVLLQGRGHSLGQPGHVGHNLHAELQVRHQRVLLREEKSTHCETRCRLSPQCNIACRKKGAWQGTDFPADCRHMQFPVARRRSDVAKRLTTAPARTKALLTAASRPAVCMASILPEVPDATADAPSRTVFHPPLLAMPGPAERLHGGCWLRAPLEVSFPERGTANG